MRIRSGYSFRTAIGKIDNVHDVVLHLGWGAAPLSDRLSTFGFRQWRTLCKKANIKPVYGVELGVTPQHYRDNTQKNTPVDYWTFFAKDDIKDLHNIIDVATRHTTSNKKPHLTYKEIEEHGRGLVKLMGESVLLDHVNLAMPSLYLSLSPATPRGLFREVVRRNGAFVATSNNHFPQPQDKEAYRVLLGRYSTESHTWPQSILTDLEWCQHTLWAEGHLDKALANRQALLDQCKAELRNADQLHPTPAKTLPELCQLGAKRLGLDLNDPVYAERLERELRLIEDKGFADYFYIIEDIISYAKQHMIVGPARGSSCGSLVCYLLNITTIDPIKYNLLFERFIDINRTDMPDIDIDFSEYRREIVFDYARQKYGYDHVARLGTVTNYKALSILNQFGKSIHIPAFMIDKLHDNMIERKEGDPAYNSCLIDTLHENYDGKQLLAEYPEIEPYCYLEGHPNNSGQHAAGIVITQEPVSHYVAIDARTRATMCDKRDAEEFNLLKIDALGLSQLSIFERTLQLIGERDCNGWLEQLPLDDQLAFDVLNAGKFCGIFQFNGAASQVLTRQINVNCLEDLVALTSLVRPGPLNSSQLWANRHNGESEVEYPHQLFEPILRDTLGVITYQEQIMRMAREVANMEWPDVISMRKAMGKKLGPVAMAAYKDKFVGGCIANNIDEEIATKVFAQMVDFGAYAFNRSHAVAYAMMSYWCMYLKAHYPVEFAAATLDSEDDPQRQIKLLRELKLEGVDYIPIDKDLSEERWKPVERNGKQLLVGPLTAIKGVGPAGMKAILNARIRGERLSPAIAKKLENAKTDIDTLFPIRDSIANMDTTSVVSNTTPVYNVQPGIRGEVVIIGAINRMYDKDMNDKDSVARRGTVLSGNSMSLNLFVVDDTDEIFCKIGRDDYERLGLPVKERGGVGKAIYAIKGTCPKGFRMLWVQRIKFLGMMQ